VSGVPTLLVVRAQTGDRAALNELLTMLQAPLYRHIVSVLGEESGADDVLQDVLLIIARKLGSVREPQYARAWAFRIAHREAVRAARRTKPEEIDLELAAVSDADSEPLFDERLIKAVPHLIFQLPPAARMVILLHYLEGLSLLEIAEALGVPLGTVKSRLAYALSKLRREVTAL
jgi:RNA polymerase sigma-70 factor (ECF subfamily)